MSAERRDEPTRQRRAHWYHERHWLLVLIFFVLGPLAIPLVWSSPVVSRRGKIVLTVVAVAYTLATLGAMVEAVRSALDLLHGGIDVSRR